MNDAQKQLKPFFDIILSSSNPGEIRQTLHSLHDIYSASSGVSAGNITDKDIFTPGGQAISPIKAAHCLLEIQRTAKLVRGIHQALLELKERFKGEKLNILYAGCGPYATLLTPLTCYFSADEVSFIMMDISGDALTAVDRMYASLGLSSYIKRLTLADACTHVLTENERVHMAVSETMNTALYKEPQVAIMKNLIPQLMEGAVFIPQEISVSMQLTDPGLEIASLSVENMVPERIWLGELYRIGRDHLPNDHAVPVEVPEEPGKFRQVTLFTEIRTYGAEVLTTNECSLTMPKKVGYSEDYKGKKLSVSYISGNNPRFEFTPAEADA